MGGVNSINVLQSILGSIFKDMGREGKSFMVYVDDIIIMARTLEEMERHLQEFFQTCRHHNVVLKWTKSNLLRKDDIKILGFSFSTGRLKPQQEKLDKIDIALKKLKTPKELRALLASLNYYRCFTPGFHT